MRRALLLRGHHTQGAYTHLTDETNQPEPHSEDPIPAAAEETNAADRQAEVAAAPQADDRTDAIVEEAQQEAEPEAEPEPMSAEAAPEPEPMAAEAAPEPEPAPPAEPEMAESQAATEEPSTPEPAPP